MALNPNGEPHDEFGPYRVVPLKKWKDSPLFLIACENAAAAFAKSGALIPVKLDEDGILVQEYTSGLKLEFIFAKRIAGVEHFYRYHWNLNEPPQLIAELKTAGLWDDEITVH